MSGVLGTASQSVMAGLVPAIHVFANAHPEDVDARDRRGHDSGEVVQNFRLGIKPGVTQSVTPRRF